MKRLLPSLAIILILTSCKDKSKQVLIKEKHVSATEIKEKKDSTNKSVPVADASTIMARKQVPVLCYHHIRNIQMASKANMGYEVSISAFQQQMKALHDNGYHTITPDQYYDYLTKGSPLPDKPVMITFDDTDEEQYTIGKTELDKYGFKGVYFIMTVSINRPHYMSATQIRQLSEEGHTIASHTWNHSQVPKYKGDDWNIQLDQPQKKLEEITGKKVEYFAYPYGLWNEAAIPELKKRGYKMAFQLSTKRDSLEPLFTVRRMIISADWSAPGTIKVMEKTFR
jgi:peptidoglycan/xylan/chitin deacetylase (PgdA/CDA1 family)